ncbi:beta-lactamase family protein [Aggregatimonas sangjinii]|uniref:Beta-lactamase family protein n=1 Tax=Aggregatimonas sangjinii TaxID=2583587 RepID=A0A5B7SS92_9FLAO|nr:serine hydrolase domain-containing protein [Aggregatimonas sangjinii]QCW99850.1 beta-lactamase family protein [Aggregatimonas sangjinii]
MQRSKILVGAVGVVVLLAIGLASMTMATETDASQDTASGPTPVALQKEQEKARKYASRKLELQKALRRYFEKAIQSGEIVGAGVSIVKGDSIVISDGFGKRKSSEAKKVNGETVFRLGSLSKGFAGLLAADLKSEGKIDWQDKLTDYLPEFQLGDEANTANIKISHILSHSSGTPYHSFTNLVEAGLSPAEIAKRFHEVRPQNVPGKQYSYQNAMFALSQEVVRKATGKDVKSALQTRFFTPLGMETTSMDHKTLQETENVAVPHGKAKNGWRSLPLKDRYYNAVVAGGIDASALDMAKWMRFILGHNPEVMTAEAIAEVFQPVIELRANNKYYQRWPGHVTSSYGYGWRIHQFKDTETDKDYTIWHHGGSVNNYRNEIAIYPEADLGICVLLNGNSRLASTVIPDVHRLIKNIYN